MAGHPATPTPFDSDETCWNTIGVWGEREPRCELLPEVIHCQNCEVYCKAGRGLLEREPTADYLQEWQEELAEEKVKEEAASQSLVVFRLGMEYLALPMRALLEVRLPGTGQPARPDAALRLAGRPGGDRPQRRRQHQ
jgi:chemotaxis-related protein WspD